jgi:glutathione S-transferase
MKLYNANLSPFTSRCRIQIYAKGLDVELVEPPGGIVPGGSTSDAYKELNPIGKIPSLDVDGEIIPESGVICEYLEDRFPTPSLRPTEPLDAARMRTLSRIVDLYLVPPMQVLFRQLDPATRDAELVREKIGEVTRSFDLLERFVGKGPFAVGESLSLADCALVPLLFFATRILPMLGAPSPVEGRPRIAAWWEAIQKEPAPSKVLAEMDESLRQAFGG